MVAEFPFRTTLQIAVAVHLLAQLPKSISYHVRGKTLVLRGEPDMIELACDILA